MARDEARREWRVDTKGRRERRTGGARGGRKAGEPGEGRGADRDQHRTQRRSCCQVDSGGRMEQLRERTKKLRSPLLLLLCAATGGESLVAKRRFWWCGFFLRKVSTCRAAA